jgi:hypothetical protein
MKQCFIKYIKKIQVKMTVIKVLQKIVFLNGQIFCLMQRRFRILFGAAFHFGIPGWKKKKKQIEIKIDCSGSRERFYIP